VKLKARDWYARSNHVQRLRCITTKAPADEQSRRDSESESSLDTDFLSTLPDDVILLCVHAMHDDALGRLRAAYTLTAVCSTFRAGLQSGCTQLASKAAYELVNRGPHSSQLKEGLCNMSGQAIGMLECMLIARALTCGMLNDVTTIWLQHNLIDTRGLQHLARGLRGLPVNGARLRSISLGANQFHKALKAEDPINGPCARALDQLFAAADDRYVRLRLKS